MPSSSPHAETVRPDVPSRVAMLGILFRAAAFTRPGTSPIGIRKVLTHWFRSTAHLETFRCWIGDDRNPALQEVIEARPSILVSLLHPYLHSAWQSRQKLEVIASHYALLQGRMAFLRATSTRAIELARLEGGLHIQLEAPGKFEHEGQLVISLAHERSCLYSLAFTLGDAHGQRMAYVGALQGQHSPDALQTYRELTHRMHGLRPRDLLVTAFRELCRALGLRKILAVSDETRVCSNRYFASSSRVFASYDAAWLENGGVAAENGFFELDACLTPRSHEDIPSRKRALYRRRYALVAELAEQIFRNVPGASTACPA